MEIQIEKSRRKNTDGKNRDSPLMSKGKNRVRVHSTTRIRHCLLKSMAHPFSILHPRRNFSRLDHL